MSSFFEVQAQQRRRTTVLLAIEVLMLSSVGYLLTVPWQFWQSCGGDDDSCGDLGFDWSTAIWCVLLVAAYLMVAVASAPRWALKMPTRPPSGSPREKRLVPLAEQMAIAAGLPRPEVRVLDDPSLNAFAAWDKGVPVVVVTSALTRALNDRQMTGVLAHEVAHLKNGDARVAWMATFGVGIIVVLAVGATLIAMSAASQEQQAPRRSDDESSGSSGAGAAALGLAFAVVLWLVAYPASLVLRATLSRRREQLADASAVQYTRDPGGLRQALEILGAATGRVRTVRVSNASLWIRDPGFDDRMPRWVARMLATHPPIETRIEWLRSLEGASTDWIDFT